MNPDEFLGFTEKTNKINYYAMCELCEYRISIEGGGGRKVYIMTLYVGSKYTESPFSQESGVFGSRFTEYKKRAFFGVLGYVGGMAKIKKRLGGKGCRKKGHSFEREVAILFRGIFPNAKRHLETRRSDVTGVDLDHTGEFRIQCKRGRNYAPLARIFEVQIDPFEGGVPVLITKGDEVEALAALPLSDFLCLIRKSRRKG